MPQHCDGSSDCTEPSEDPSTRKLQLEIEKLAAETQHISQQTTGWAETRRCIVTLGGVLSSLALIATLLFSILDYSDQRRANREFEVTQEIVSLARQLSSEADLTKRTAALLLASYGDKAIDLLTASLSTTDKGLAAQIILSLHQIKKDLSSVEKEKVAFSLVLQAKINFCDANDFDPQVTPLYHYLSALTRLIPTSPSSDLLSELNALAMIFQGSHHLRSHAPLHAKVLNTLRPFIGDGANVVNDPWRSTATLCEGALGGRPS